MGAYYFDSTDGCELCAAMAGWYDEEPPRPHPNCNCTITSSAQAKEVDGSSWSYKVEQAQRDSQRPGQAFSFLVKVQVECYNGRTIEDSIVVKFEESEAPKKADWMERLSEETDEEAKRFAEGMSESCGDGDTYISDYKKGEPLPD